MTHEGASRSGNDYPQADEMEQRNDLSPQQDIQQDEYSGTPERGEHGEPRDANKDHPHR